MASKIGLYKGKLHSEGGIPEVVVETGRKIEVETDEYRLCPSLLESNKVYEFVNKTNREILDTLHKASCEFEQGKIPAGSFIICRLAVLDDTRRNIYGTVKEIINVMQGDHSCRVFGSDGNEMENGGEVCGCEHDVKEFATTKSVETKQVNRDFNDGSIRLTPDPELSSDTGVPKRTTDDNEPLDSKNKDIQKFDMGGIIQEIHEFQEKGELRNYIIRVLENDLRKSYDLASIPRIADGVILADDIILNHRENNPLIVSATNELIFFEPDSGLWGREKNNIDAYIKYAAHFVCSKKDGYGETRYYNENKEKALHLIEEVIKDPSVEKWYQYNGDERPQSIVYVRDLPNVKKIYTIIAIEAKQDGELVGVTLLPDYKKRRVDWSSTPFIVGQTLTPKSPDSTKLSHLDSEGDEPIESKTKDTPKNDTNDKKDEKLSNGGEIFDNSEEKVKEVGFGCLMIGIHCGAWDTILKEISPEDIYNEPGYGLEKEPHITLLYGFHDKEVDPQAVLSEAKKHLTGSTEIKLTNITLFENDAPYDVVKFDVDADVLHKINADLISKFPNTQTFPEYHPHTTIAYVKKGTGKKYVNKLESPIIVEANEIIYSHPDDSYGGTGKRKEVLKLKYSEAEKEAMIHTDTFKKVRGGLIRTPRQLGESLAKDHKKIELEAKMTKFIELLTPIVDTTPNHSDFVDRLMSDTDKGVVYNKPLLEKIGREYHIKEQNTVKELAELSIVIMARKIANGEGTVKEKYNKIVNLYRNQVNLSHRTSESIMLQQYSTPCFIGFLAGLYCKVNELSGDEYAFEPSAGNGQLTIAGNPKQFIVNEIGKVRNENLKIQGFKKVLKQDATEPFYDYQRFFKAVLTNPPFGTTDMVKYGALEVKSLEQLMALRGLDCMRDDGRCAIIVGGHTEYVNGLIQAGKNRQFFVYLYKHYDVEDVINLDGHKLYSRQGTGFNVRLILVSGRKETPGGLPPIIEHEMDATETNSPKAVDNFDVLYERVIKLI